MKRFPLAKCPKIANRAIVCECIVTYWHLVDCLTAFSISKCDSCRPYWPFPENLSAPCVKSIFFPLLFCFVKSISCVHIVTSSHLHSLYDLYAAKWWRPITFLGSCVSVENILFDAFIVEIHMCQDILNLRKRFVWRYPADILRKW